MREHRPSLPAQSESSASAAQIESDGEASQSVEPPKAPSFISKLFPPPPTLIKETLGRYKPAEPTEAPSYSDESPEASHTDSSDEIDPPETKLEE